MTVCKKTPAFFRVLVLAAVGVTAGMAQEPPKTKPPVEQKTAVNDEVKSANAAAVPEASAPVDPKTYKVGPEDILQIVVWRERELSGLFVVRPDGRITLPLAGEMVVQDLAPETIKENVTKAYSQYVNNPEVTVSLQRVGSKKYFLVGEVNKAGQFPLVVPITVLEALNAAGGLREFANKKKITILRGNQRLKFNYDEVIKGKKLEQNIIIESGDHIIVP